MNEIKPIETVYNGYKFRSRLEARWAVFFDAMGIEYEYEPEGYKGFDGTYYLPDFYLQSFDVYAEVKGSDEQLWNDAHKLESVIDWEMTPISYKGIILLGPIPYKEFSVPYFDLLYWYKGVFSTKCLFDMLDERHASFLHGEYYKQLPESEYWHAYGISDDFISCGAPIPDNVSVNAKYQNADNTLIAMFDPFRNVNDCYAKARQARFEHGETPRP